MIYVIFNPDPTTIAKCYDSPQSGSVEMTEAEFIAWRDAQPEIAKPPPVPESVRSTQIKQWLVDHDKWDALQAVLGNVQTFGGDAKAQIKTQIRFGEPTWRRADPTLNAIGQAIGMTPTDIDQAFIEAEKDYP